MSQIGTPQKNILEPMASGYPSTTPAAAGKSALLLGQTLVDDSNQEKGGRPQSETAPIPNPARVSVLQPDLPKVNAQHKNVSDPVTTFASGTTGGPYDVTKSAAARATANGLDPALVESATVLAQPLSGGPGTGYGAMSGGTPAGVGSDGAGSGINTQASFAAINRSGSRNNASINVIHRPGDNQAAFVF